MIYYIESRQTDPYLNLALEQLVFDSLDRRHSYFMLWQNANSIIIGKHQNARAEINAAFVEENGITVARRLSGGGAVYHDMGNLNFTFIRDAGEGGIDFAAFCAPIRDALLSLGVPVEIAGRNDMTVEGKKFSGNAQYIKQNRIMHHGTILYDSDMSVLGKALKPGDEKIESKGIKSVQSRVTNIRPYMKNDMPMNDFWAALYRVMKAALGLEELPLTEEHWAEARALREKVYAQWSWNYGNSPPCTLRKARRVEGCGKIEIFLDMEREGRIKSAVFYGDFFGRRDPGELGGLLAGRRLEYNDIKAALSGVVIAEYFHGLDFEGFAGLLLG